jgi:hypothetical protein
MKRVLIKAFLVLIVIKQKLHLILQFKLIENEKNLLLEMCGTIGVHVFGSTCVYKLIVEC